MTVRAPEAPVEFQMASSLRSARRDEFVYVGEKGEVLPLWRYRAGQAMVLPATTLTAGLGVWSCVALGIPFLSLAFVGAVGWIGHTYLSASRVRTGAALMVAQRYAEAEEVLGQVARSRFAPRSVRGVARQNLGGLALRRGDRQGALEHIRTARVDLDRAGRGAGPWRWINRHAEVQVLAQLDRVPEARGRLAELDAAPEGEYFQLLRMNSELLIAFHARSADGLPADLHEWSRFALETTSAELALVLLGWAHHERGDTDMGDHLLREGRGRLDPALFSVWFPGAWAWLEGRDIPTLDDELGLDFDLED